MSIEVEVLIEAYSIMKQYVPKKDQQEAADNVISVLVDMLSDQALSEFAESDTSLTKAVKTYSLEDEADDYDSEDDEY